MSPTLHLHLVVPQLAANQHRRLPLDVRHKPRRQLAPSARRVVRIAIVGYGSSRC
jgi:hypothetical protein